MAIGNTKAGKTNLLNHLIGKFVLKTSELMCTSTKWTVGFHLNQKFILQIH